MIWHVLLCVSPLPTIVFSPGNDGASGGVAVKRTDMRLMRRAPVPVPRPENAIFFAALPIQASNDLLLCFYSK
jgi:hypothetical protein